MAVDSGAALWWYYPQPDCSGERSSRVRTCVTVIRMMGTPAAIAGAPHNASIVAANGYLFVNSGYGIIGGQTSGNMCLAFHVRPH